LSDKDIVDINSTVKETIKIMNTNLPDLFTYLHICTLSQRKFEKRAYIF